MHEEALPSVMAKEQMSWVGSKHYAWFCYKGVYKIIPKQVREVPYARNINGIKRSSNM